MIRIRSRVLEDLEQGKVSVRHGLVEPVLLHEILVLRVPHIRKMMVKQEQEVALRGGIIQEWDAFLVLPGDPRR